MKEQDYLKDLAEIRSMMERSSKFLSLSGWAGIMAGIYALAGVWAAYALFNFNPQDITSEGLAADIKGVLALALLTLMFAVTTAIYLSYRKAAKNGERGWNPVSRRLAVNMLVPLAAGGILILILLSKGLPGLMAPLSLLFYGLALYNAGKFTYDEVKFMGMIQIALGLLSSWFIEYSLLLWAIGFGIVHMVYGIYMHFRYER